MFLMRLKNYLIGSILAATSYVSGCVTLPTYNEWPNVRVYRFFENEDRMDLMDYKPFGDLDLILRHRKDGLNVLDETDKEFDYWNEKFIKLIFRQEILERSK